MLALPVVLAECTLVDLCTYESRFASAAGRTTEGATEIASATVDVSGTRGSQQDKSFSWSITAAPLAGHVTSIAVVHSDPAVLVRLPLPVEAHPAPSLYAGGLVQYTGDLTPNLEGIYEVVEENRAVIELTTDLQQYPLVKIPLTVTAKQDWHRANCS